MLLPVFLPWLLLCFHNLRGLDKSGNGCQPEGLVGPGITEFVKSEHFMLWFCCPGVLGTKLGCSDANLPSEVWWWQRDCRMRKIIYLHWGFFSGQQEKTSSEEQGDNGRWKPVCSVWDGYWSCCCSHLEREISSLQQENEQEMRRQRNRVGIEAPTCPAVSLLLNTLACE